MTSVPSRKSRSGCSNCKERRIKCDESKPKCLQCVQKRLDCAGYGPRWKWSTKHEKVGSLQYRGHREPRGKGYPSRDGHIEAADVVVQQPKSVDTRGSPVSSDDQVHGVSKIAPDALQDGDVDGASGETLEHQDTQSNHQDNQSNTAQAAESTGEGQRPIPSRKDQDMVVSNSCLRSPDTLLCNPQLQVDFFSQQICKVLCAYDSQYNPFRVATVSRADASLLSFSLCRYLTAAFLCSKFGPGAGNGLTVRDAQTEVLHRLQNEVARLDISRQNEIEEVLMAIIMYGLSTNWDGSNDPSFMHYNAAVWLFRQTYKTGNVTLSTFDKKSFFQQSLTYWWMGLCFVTDSTEDVLAAPPGVDDEERAMLDSARAEKRLPHPLAGVSPEAQCLLGRVGSLVYTQRKRCQSRPFTSLGGLQKEYDALEEAKELEEALLSLEISREEDLVDIEDPATPLKDLINTANVYRLSALVLLYHAFPDLLIVRLTWRLNASVSANKLEEERLQWLCDLAVHTLELLCGNSATSGTRSIEQILLVILAGELRMPSSLMGEHSAAAGTSDAILDLGSCLNICSPAEVSCDDVFSTLFQADLSDEEADLTMNTFQCKPWNKTTTRDRVSEARSIVVRRLRSIQQILPYKSLELVEELILETWKLQDMGRPEKFWMDVMIENGWQFLLV